MQGAGENFAVSKDNMEQLKEQLQKAIKEVPHFEKFKNHIDMTVTNEGLRIELTESEKGTYFDRGSAKMSEEGEELLHALVTDFGKIQITFTLDGHTISKQYTADRKYVKVK